MLLAEGIDESLSRVDEIGAGLRVAVLLLQARRVVEAQVRDHRMARSVGRLEVGHPGVDQRVRPRIRRGVGDGQVEHRLQRGGMAASVHRLASSKNVLEQSDALGLAAAVVEDAPMLLKHAEPNRVVFGEPLAGKVGQIAREQEADVAALGDHQAFALEPRVDLAEARQHHDRRRIGDHLRIVGPAKRFEQAIGGLDALLVAVLGHSEPRELGERLGQFRCRGRARDLTGLETLDRPHEMEVRGIEQLQTQVGDAERQVQFGRELIAEREVRIALAPREILGGVVEQKPQQREVAALGLLRIEPREDAAEERRERLRAVRLDAPGFGFPHRLRREGDRAREADRERERRGGDDRHRGAMPPRGAAQRVAPRVAPREHRFAGEMSVEIQEQRIGAGVAVALILGEALQADRIEVAAKRRGERRGGRLASPLPSGVRKVAAGEFGASARGRNRRRADRVADPAGAATPQGLAIDRRLAAEQFVEDHAEGVQVAADVRRLGQSVGLLGAHVLGRPDRVSRFGRRRSIGERLVEALRDAEVDHDRLRTRVELVDEDVRRLEIAVQHAAAMGVRHRIDDAPEELDAGPHIEAPRIGVAQDRVAAHVRHREEGTPVVGGPRLEDAGDARMREPRERLLLALESPQDARAVEAVAKDLDRDEPLRRSHRSPEEHLAEASLADAGEQPVAGVDLGRRRGRGHAAEIARTRAIEDLDHEAARRGIDRRRVERRGAILRLHADHPLEQRPCHLRIEASVLCDHACSRGRDSKRPEIAGVGCRRRRSPPDARDVPETPVRP